MEASLGCGAVSAECAAGPISSGWGPAGLPQGGGVTNGGLSGVWPPFPEIGLFPAFSSFF